MLGADFKSIPCPYCNESLDVVVEASVHEQEYIEDCQVCCRPITYRVRVEPDEIRVEVATENDA